MKRPFGNIGFFVCLSIFTGSMWKKEEGSRSVAGLHSFSVILADFQDKDFLLGFRDMITCRQINVNGNLKYKVVREANLRLSMYTECFVQMTKRSNEGREMNATTTILTGIIGEYIL